MVYLLALGSALVNALVSVLQRLGVQNAPANAALRLSLIRHALRRGVWLLGFALMLVSFLLQAVALHIGRLSEVQPILTTELVFLAAILAIWFRFRIGWREWMGAIAVTAGLSFFLYFAAPRYGMTTPPLWRWLVTGGICVGIIAGTVLLATRGPRWWRATMFGTAASISFAFTAACTKAVSDFASSDWTQLYKHWEVYALGVFGGLAVFLTQNAIHAGPLVASQSTVVLIDPLASICIGIGLFGDDLQTNGAAGPVEALALLVAFLGAFWLARSKLIAAMNEGERLELQPRRSRPEPLPGTAP
jgi:drug/metabolite transporter (DMT)-like permease